MRIRRILSLGSGFSLILAGLAFGAGACSDDDPPPPVSQPTNDSGLRPDGSTGGADGGRDTSTSTDTGTDTATTDTGPADTGADTGPTSTKTLYVWAGRRAPTDGGPPPTTSDVVVAFDADPTSPNYKKATQVVEVGAVGNEPHHGGICGNKLIVGGVRSGKIFTMPIDSAGKLGTVTQVATVGTDVGGADEIVCVGDKVFITWLGNGTGQSPGAVVEHNVADMSVVGQYPRVGEDSPAETGTVNGLDLATVTGVNTRGTFNPHGIAIDTAADIMLTTDSLVPASAGGGGPPTFRSTVRVWQYSTRKIIQTVPVCVGAVSVQFVPTSNATQAAVACDFQTELWTMVKDGANKWSAAKAASPEAGAPFPFFGTMGAGVGEKAVYVAQANPGLIIKYDLTTITAVTQAATLNTGPGAHYVRMSGDGKRLFSSDYVQQGGEAPNGPLPPSDGKVWIVNTTNMTLDGSGIDLHTSTDPLLAPLGPLNPHAVMIREQ